MYAGDHRRDSFHQAPTTGQLGRTPTPQAKSDTPSHSYSSGQLPLVVGTARRPSSGQEQGHTATPVIRKARRKFPGPAGLLPRLVRYSIFVWKKSIFIDNQFSLTGVGLRRGRMKIKQMYEMCFIKKVSTIGRFVIY